MAYEYITDNNLYEKQNYMYSAYRGTDFLKDYLNSRYQYIESVEMSEEDMRLQTPFFDDPVQQDLMNILQKLNTGTYDRETINEVNAYTKSFEVRKRIYSGYDNAWKPIEGASFENYQNYLLFADCLLHIYYHTKCLKYFSCLLKVDDTLLSVYNLLPEKLRGYFGRIISQELNIFGQLTKEHGIGQEVAG